MEIYFLVLAILYLFFFVVLQRRHYFLQYTYFLRVQWVSGLILLGFPFLARYKFSVLLGNLFVLEGIQVSVACASAVLAALVVTYTFGLAYTRLPLRLGLPFLRGADRFQPNLAPQILRRWFWIPVLVLAAPTCAVVASAPGFSGGRLFFVLLGLVGALVVSVVNYLVLARLANGLVGRVADLGHVISGRLPLPQWFGDLFRGYDDPHLPDEGGPRGQAGGVYRHRSVVALFVVVGVLYLAGAALLSPAKGLRFESLARTVPPVFYVFLLLILLCLILSALSYFLDRFRVPLLISIAILSGSVSVLVDTNHYFSVTLEDAPSVLPSPGACLEKRLGFRKSRELGDDLPLVVFAVSGGGIAASRWAARVYYELGRDEDLGAEFFDSVVLFSTVSGGGVGTASFVGRFTESGPPGEQASQEALEFAGASSLSSLAWGLTYPDFWRFASGFGFWKGVDRGWALEEAWKAASPELATSVGAWREGVAAGWRPLQLFNCTVVETGDRTVLGSDRTSKFGSDFFAGQPTANFSVATAARMSATFPFITPVARPRIIEDRRPKGEETANSTIPGYHLADGGYYDNYGILTAIEFLGEGLEGLQKAGRKIPLVIIVEIRLFASTESESPLGAWTAEIFGPLQTTLGVRGAAQAERGDFELKLFQSKWRTKGVDVESLRFATTKEDPLSWHLSPSQRMSIDDSWKSDENQAALSELRRLFGTVKPDSK